jgi:hypothetical protein
MNRWSLAFNDWLGIPRSGWGENFPLLEIILFALIAGCIAEWVLWVTRSIRKLQK